MPKDTRAPKSAAKSTQKPSTTRRNDTSSRDDCVEAAAPSNAATATVAEPPRLSALDAAARVLAENTEPTGLNARQLVERMAARGLWTSPAGKTPSATLYAAMIRDIAKRGDASRFRRASPGHFLAAGTTKAAVSKAASKARSHRPTTITKPFAPAAPITAGVLPHQDASAAIALDTLAKPARKRRRTGGRA